MRILHRYKKNPCNVQYSIDTGGIEYGLLYNWYVATDTRNIAANGWYIPSKAEMDGLVTHLGGASVAGGKLKETGMTYWKSPNTGATNEVGFNGRGGGKRNPSPSFNSLNIETLIMSSTTGGVNYHYLYLTANSSQATTSNIFTFKGGSSIRLVSDATGVADGTTTTYVGNDGKVYKAIAINGLYWLAENLAETKYRNGNIIPEVTDNTEWGNLTTGALCAYENDWNYVETTSDPNAINYALISGELPITVELIGNTTHTNNHIILESGSFTDIPGGTYTFKVTDALGCEESEIIEIPYSEPIALNSSYDIDRKTLETCTVFKGFDYTVFGFTGETMFDRVKITSVPTNGTLSRGLLDTILVNDELIYPSDFNNGLYYRTSSIEKVDYSDTIGFQVRVNGLWSNTATITINVNSCIFADDCIEYGYLYNWYAATDVRNIANDGWHLPTHDEAKTLADYLGASGDYSLNAIGGKLKETGFTYWDSPNTGATNEVGFNARGTGYRNQNDGTFRNFNLQSYTWTTNTSTIYIGGYLGLSNSNDRLMITNTQRGHGNPIRLIKDATTLSHGETGIYIGNDGKIYSTICIGTQEWLAENLAETQFRDGTPIPIVEDNTAWAALTTAGMCAYNNDYSLVGCDEVAPSTGGCVEYGYLYNWYAVSDVRNIANTGWHAMTWDDMMNLLNYVTGGNYDYSDMFDFFNESYNGGELKDTGIDQWEDPNLYATNEYGFNAVGSGIRFFDGSFLGINEVFTVYTSDKQIVQSELYSGEFDITNSSMFGYLFTYGFNEDSEHTLGRSSRLVSDVPATGLTDGATGTYTGNDGKIYPTVVINEKWWLADNLAETKYRNGDPIPTVEDNATWAGLTTGAKCAYGNDYTNVGCDETGDELTTYPTIEYGLLYNWYAATDARNICSVGWSIPTQAQLTTLQTYLGGKTLAGGKMKETGFIFWDSPNTGATNEVGFNARGAGLRNNSTGIFYNQRLQTIYISSTEYDATRIKSLGLGNNATNASFPSLGNPKKTGYSIRPVNDSTTLTHGQTGTYIGNDGKIYRTICIGTQEWLAENLAETKYRNGNIIPEVTDNTEWGNLTTGALCAYENDWNYVGRTKPDYY